MYEKCSKHEAILKAQSPVTGRQLPVTGKQEQAAAKLIIEADVMVKEAVLTKLFKYYAKVLPLTKKAVNNLQSRLLDCKLHEAGYNSGDWHHKLNEKNY